MFAYFAHPIDQAGHSSRTKQQIASVRAICALAGVGLYRPGTAFQLETKDANAYPFTIDDFRVINEINKAAIWETDALIALLPDGVATLGVPVEIEMALTYGKPVLILTEAMVAERSVQLSDWVDQGAHVRTCNNLGSFGHIDSGTLRLLLAASLTKEEDDLILPVKLEKGALPPSRAYSGDAGFDLAVLEDTEVPPRTRVMLRTGIQAPPPPGWWGLIKARSSTYYRHGLTVHEAVIDAGYTGELKIAVSSDYADLPTKIEAGTRLAQYILMPTYPGQVQVVDILPDAERGSNGFGSSGH